MQESIAFLLRVQCRIFSRSLSHLLMSFLLFIAVEYFGLSIAVSISM